MKSMLNSLRRRFVREDSGQDLLEYALLVALIAIFCVGAISAAGGSVQDVFQNIADEIAAAL
jgi:pilus assembly protein Flp/PilA